MCQMSVKNVKWTSLRAPAKWPELIWFAFLLVTDPRDLRKKKKSLLPTVQDTGEDRDITVAVVYLGLWCTIVMKAENKF